jgi:hypothetical protein
VGKQLTIKNILVIVVILLLVAQGFSWYQLGKTNQKIKDNQATMQQTLNDLDSAMQQTALSPIPEANRLYLAELNITVPLNPTTSSVRYNFSPGASGGSGDEVRLASTAMTDHTMHTKSCSDMVRLKIEAKPNVYSPEQPLYTTVQLADGRALQVYASTTHECQLAWQTVSPQDIAEAFKAASVY